MLGVSADNKHLRHRRGYKVVVGRGFARVGSADVDPKHTLTRGRVHGALPEAPPGSEPLRAQLDADRSPEDNMAPTLSSMQGQGASSHSGAGAVTMMGFGAPAQRASGATRWTLGNLTDAGTDARA